MKTILVTGGTGFVGKNFISTYGQSYRIISPSLRSNSIENIDFSGVDCVLHLAAKVHDMRVQVSNAYDEVNFQLTKQLADKAKTQGVPHFVFVSSVKVYGDNTEGVLDEQSPCRPDDDYGRSKWKAEVYLQSMVSDSFKVTIVRPPMVYGPSGKGNMQKLIGLCTKGKPLPFGNINNRRTLVYIGNMVVYLNAIITQGAEGVFIPADTGSISTTEMIRTIQETLFGKVRIFAIPAFLRMLIRRLKPAVYRRLFGSFEFNNTSTLQALKPSLPYTTKQGLQETVAAFKTDGNL